MSDTVLTTGTLVQASIVPMDPADTYATNDSNLGKGGFKSMADAATRNLMSEDRLRSGMVVYLRDTRKFYKLKLGHAIPSINADWEETSFKILQLVFYVATTGDDADDGTAANPFLTIQKGVNEAFLVSSIVNDLVVVYVADGTYEESITMPSGSGYVRVVGNTTTPTNVVIDAKSNNVFNVLSPGANIEIDGVEFYNAAIGLYNIGSRVTLKYCYMKNVDEGIYCINGGHVKLEHDVDGDIAIDCMSVAGLPAIYCDSFSTIDIDQDLTTSLSDIGILCDNFSNIIFNAGKTITLNTIAAGGAYGLLLKNNSLLTTSANITIDLKTALTGNKCIEVSSSIVNRLTGNWVFNNAAQGLNFNKSSYVGSSSGYFNCTYNTIGVDLLVDQTSYYYAIDNFDTVPRFLKEADVTYGADTRYFNYALAVG